MFEYYITTDQTADFPQSLYEDNFFIIPMSYTIDGIIYDGKTVPYLSSDKFYEYMAEGKLSKTTMVTDDDAYKFFRALLLNKKDVLHIAFSSALSGCYQSYLNAQKRLISEFPNQKLVIIDSKGASIGEGLLCYYALQKRESGATISDNAIYLNELREHIGHSFTVDDIYHLFRGGRITKNQAIVGSVVKIKPVLTVNKAGELVHTNNAIGRRIAMRMLIDKMLVKSNNINNELIIIGHGACIDDAVTLKRMLLEVMPNTKIVVTEIGEVIGSHCGKGMLAMTYLSKDKTPTIK